MTTQRIAILGAGNMGRALIGGLLRQGTRPEHLSVGESSAAARASLESEFGVTATSDNIVTLEGASAVVVAVKPQAIESVLTPLRAALAKARPVLISVAAGIRIASLRSWCGEEVRIVRAMPNRPVLVGAGATGLFAPIDVEAAHRGSAERILRAVGEVVWVAAEDALDVVTALSGSGPAYFFLLAELMSRSAIELGLDAAAAHRLAVATLHGAGQLAFSGAGDLARLREEVTSRGGTTEAALQQLHAAGLERIVAQALAAASRRSRELAEQFGAPH